MATDQAGEDVGDVGVGSDVVQLAGLDGEAGTTQCWPPPSELTESACLRLSAIGRMAHSPVSESSSMQPSLWTRPKPSQRLSASRIVSVSLLYG